MISPIFKRFDKCMSDFGHSTDSCEADCPLLKDVILEIGSSNDEHGGITWKIQACSLMSILDKALQEG